MAEDNNPRTPASMTLMAGPIDTRISPTKVNELAHEKPMSWFESKLIARVPLRYKGARRRVYPGFIQLSAFMAMNMDRHVKAHVDLFHNLAGGDMEKANQTKAFYDEYFAVLDLAAGILSRDRAMGVPGSPTAARHDEISRPHDRSQGDPPAPPCSPSRASATISAPSARPWRRTISRPA